MEFLHRLMVIDAHGTELLVQCGERGLGCQSDSGLSAAGEGAERGTESNDSKSEKGWQSTAGGSGRKRRNKLRRGSISNYYSSNELVSPFFRGPTNLKKPVCMFTGFFFFCNELVPTFKI